MKNFKIIALILILALSFSVLTSCDVLDEMMGNSGAQDTENPDDTTDGGNQDDENNKTPEECEHLWENSTCVKCQEVCTHNWVSGTCGICNRDCNHTWVGGICTTCGQDCTHLWGDGGICVNCGDECEHNFQDGYCTVCHKLDGNDDKPTECKHEWTWNGVCTICGYKCEHDIGPDNDYTCTICGAQAPVPPECKHEWVDGVCIHCKNTCSHPFFIEDTCEICGYVSESQRLRITLNGTTYTVSRYSTLAEFISEHLGTTYEATVANGGSWTTDYWDSERIALYANTVLSYYGDDYEIYYLEPTVSPEACKHEWMGNYCTVCGTLCEHSFVDDVCSICNKVCHHPTYSDGYICGICGIPCEHPSYTGKLCDVCGKPYDQECIRVTHNGASYDVRLDSTLSEFISEHLGTTYEATVANGSYWMALDPFNLDKINLEADTPLNQFGACFELYYIDCTPPPVCEHEWVGDYCPKCGRTCDHSYSDSVCTICGTVCSDHYFSYGSCMYCGKPCEHVWGSDYYCINCNSPCEHPELSTYGYCSVCGYECQHSWNLEYCEICGYHCEHTFEGPACTKCGYTSGGIDNPLTIYFEDTEYITPYSATFQELFYLYSDLAHRLGYNDYYESVQHGYWVVVTDSGDVGIGEYTSLCEFGHVMTIAFRKNVIEECHHPYWSYGYCTSCCIACQHGAFLDGMCGICGMPCVHSWNNGQCMICFKECEHSFYDGICNVCGFHEEGRVTFSLLMQDGIGLDSFSDYTVSVPYSIALYDFFGAALRTEDGATMFIPYETNFLVRVNGRVIDFEEFHYIYITGGEQIVIYRCYSFELETVVNGESSYIIYNTPTSVSGADLMYAAGLDPNTNCTIWINGAMFESYIDFADTIFPLGDEYCCFIRFECIDAPGVVRLEIYEEGYSSGYYEAIGELNISTYVSCGDDFGDFLWTLEYPNGDQVNLETLDMILTFMPDYITSENGASVYKLYRYWNVFWVNLQVDDECYEPLSFYKSENLTVKDILAAFGFSGEYENYWWSFNTYDGYVDGLDSIVTSDLSIYAYDARPYVELNVDGVSYKAYHTETLTLADAIDLINRTHGTSITFDAYVWYAYSNDTYRTERVYDPYTFILVEPGYTRDATAKTLTEVEVYFATDFGPINDEIGMESVTFKKGDAWWTPEIAPRILEMTGGFVIFNGGFEYRIEARNENGHWEIVERRDVNSIEELFALNLETVTLCAKYEPNYDKICGTYVNYGTILVITETTITKFNKDDGYFGEAKEYKMSISGGYPSLRALDGSFDYITNFLTYEYIKIEDGGFCAVVRTPDGWIEMYTSYDEYLYVTEWSNIDYVTDKDGNALDVVSENGLYFVYTSEKPYVE